MGKMRIDRRFFFVFLKGGVMNSEEWDFGMSDWI